MNSNTDHT